MKRKNIWQIWKQSKTYGQVLYKRATGQLPEMESSRAISQIISKYIHQETLLGDIGCGAGHYLKSFRRKCGFQFRYFGVDATKNYIFLAKKANRHDAKSSFRVGNIFNLPFPDSFFDVTVCCNLLLHLPEIQKPIKELIRTTKNRIFIRLLAGDRSFIIQDVFPQKNGHEIDVDGNPKKYCFYNIYNCEYLKSIILKQKKVKRVRFLIENSFNPRRIDTSRKDHVGAHNATHTLAGYQVNGYILQPWMVVEIELEDKFQR